MEKALFINGVYEDVLDEIVKSQEANPGRVFYLQPYSESSIKQLRNGSTEPYFPLPLYISTTRQLNQICYSADIIGWEDKNELSAKRLAFLNEHIKIFQPKEVEIYFEVKEKKCVNLISIRNLTKFSNQLSTSNLIKESDGEPLKPRTRAGSWSYVYALPLLSIDKTVVKKRLDEELEKSLSISLKDDDEIIKKRLETAPKIPEKVQTISYDFRRNPDVIAAVLKRAHGKCELCKSDAPFFKASDGTPYLEVHHWITLSEGGEDIIENAGALCPNCHKNAHFGAKRDFIKSNKVLVSNVKSPSTDEPCSY
ncbi:MAG: HNH endonuclease [Candidatus Latescibacter sp.]|nr:HNH endonuclease [Candidatus Latescibacter sp.]